MGPITKAVLVCFERVIVTDTFGQVVASDTASVVVTLVAP